jgi:predicted Rossmann fold nucleotide-binding protein DprA/Smf involved in DNA uptake
MTANEGARTLSRGEILKKLRESHSASVERTQVLVREQKKLHQSICSLIREEAKTVPEIARQLEIPSEDVLWFLMSLKKYGIVVETGMCGDYPTYKRTEEAPS